MGHANRVRSLEKLLPRRRRLLIPIERENPDVEAAMAAAQPDADIIFVLTGVPGRDKTLAGSRAADILEPVANP
jgi:type II secretory pathway component PulM